MQRTTLVLKNRPKWDSNSKSQCSREKTTRFRPRSHCHRLFEIPTKNIYVRLHTLLLNETVPEGIVFPSYIQDYLCISSPNFEPTNWGQ